MINFSLEVHELYIPGMLDNILVDIINGDIKKYIYDNGCVRMPSIRVMLPREYLSRHKNNDYVEYFVVQFDYGDPGMHIIITDTCGKHMLGCVLTFKGYDRDIVKERLKEGFTYTEKSHMIIEYILYILDHVVDMLR